eukprot:scaffold100531_cov35-Prasinocladus_malaysianus.AAC.1
MHPDVRSSPPAETQTWPSPGQSSLETRQQLEVHHVNEDHLQELGQRPADQSRQSKSQDTSFCSYHQEGRMILRRSSGPLCRGSRQARMPGDRLPYCYRLQDSQALPTNQEEGFG